LESSTYPLRNIETAPRKSNERNSQINLKLNENAQTRLKSIAHFGFLNEERD